MRLQLVFCCSARGDPNDWVLGNKESGEGPWAAYLVFECSFLNVPSQEDIGIMSYMIDGFACICHILSGAL